MKRIELTIDAEGNVKIEAHGYKGRGCLEATKAIEEAIGIAGKRTQKAEIYEATVGIENKIKK